MREINDNNCEYRIIWGVEMLQMLGLSVHEGDSKHVPSHGCGSSMAGNAFSGYHITPFWLAFYLARYAHVG